MVRFRAPLHAIDTAKGSRAGPVGNTSTRPANGWVIAAASAHSGRRWYRGRDGASAGYVPAPGPTGVRGGAGCQAHVTTRRWSLGPGALRRLDQVRSLSTAQRCAVTTAPYMQEANPGWDDDRVYSRRRLAPWRASAGDPDGAGYRCPRDGLRPEPSAAPAQGLRACRPGEVDGQNATASTWGGESDATQSAAADRAPNRSAGSLRHVAGTEDQPGVGSTHPPGTPLL